MPPPVAGLPDWLRELEAEIAGQVATPEPAELLEETEVREDVEKQPLEEPAAVGALEEVELPPEQGKGEEELPGWLRELQAEPEELEAAISAEEIEAEAVVDEQMPIAEPSTAIEPLPAVEEGEEELPAWLQELEAEEEKEPEPEGTSWEAEVEEEAPGWLREAREDVEGPQAEPAAIEPTEEPEAEQIPDWLQEMRAEVEGTEEVEREEEGLEWLADIEAEQVSRLTVDEMPAWLSQPRTPEGQQEPVEAGPGEGLEELFELPQADLELEPLEPSLPEEPEAAIDAEGLEAQRIPQVPRPDDQETHLSLARACLRQGDPDASAGEYERLVQDPALTDTLIPELEEATQAYPTHHALRRVLGDAYMRVGQLQKALDAYKAALSRL
jgi:tetratricopeptide (TPR) repeat protein